ncbi:hypothetical protein MKW98_009816 [Papaver atlanticum]|uniref:NAB domain-containing protein n=1 Tax=Papaver atlanticum TaxID=357466 RepID=A0AAD4SVA6_9MAGN|nr:hypothetical protein MKW98_009816 [Papaver atlanticum]
MMSNRTMKRLESRKSHSWWFDSHITPKSNKWLADSLQEMDRSVNRMLKLIEEEGDSFAKKAEMYYQKRPELIAQVEEFYRMYRSLAERYDNLSKSIPADHQLQTQSSAVSDAGSESGPPVPAPKEKRHTRRKSITNRAAGFEVFLGSRGGSSERADSDDYSDSSSDSETESDSIASSKNTYSGPLAANGDDMGLGQRIVELEVELRDVKERLRMAEEENSSVTTSPKVSQENGNSEDLLGRIHWYEEELNVANEKLRCTQKEIEMLTQINFENGLIDAYVKSETIQVLELQEKIAALTLEIEKSKSSEASTNVVLEEDAGVEDQNLHLSEEDEVARLKLELEETKSSLKKIEVWAAELKDQNETLEMNVSNRDTEIAELKLAISEAELKFNAEKSQLQKVISALEECQGEVEMKLKNSESSIQALVDDCKRVEHEKTEFQVLQENREADLRSEMEELKAEIVEKGSRLEELNKTLDGLKLNFDTLTAERDELNAKISSLVADVGSRDDKIRPMEEHLHKLHVEHVELVSVCEEARKQAENQTRRLREMEEEVERQRMVIIDAAEEKREAIRQLCFSMDHYRNNYDELRNAFLGHRKQAPSPVLAS